MDVLSTSHEPVIGLFNLIAVTEALLENAVAVADAVAPRRQVPAEKGEIKEV